MTIRLGTRGSKLALAQAEAVAGRLRENGWEILETRQSEGWFSYLCR